MKGPELLNKYVGEPGPKELNYLGVCRVGITADCVDAVGGRILGIVQV